LFVIRPISFGRVDGHFTKLRLFGPVGDLEVRPRIHAGEPFSRFQNKATKDAAHVRRDVQVLRT
jgi:hypothetical protein